MDHSRAPVLEALEDFRRRGDVVYGPPGHKQGRGAAPRVARVVGQDVFRSDVLLLNGLDDRRESQDVLERAQELMADAVGAERAFFSTCGSSLSVKTAMLSVAGPGEKLLLSRNAHKSVIAAVVVNGVRPVWVHPKFDADRHLAHPPEPDDVRRALAEHPDAKGMLLITPTDWGTCADVRGVPRRRGSARPRRGVGRPPALPPRTAGLGHRRGRRPGGHQRPQDGRGDRAELGLPPPARPGVARGPPAARGPPRHDERLLQIGRAHV